MTDQQAKTPEPEDEAEIDDALDDSFPASDPPSYSTPHRNEGPRSDPQNKNDAGPAKGRQR